MEPTWTNVTARPMQQEKRYKGTTTTFQRRVGAEQAPKPPTGPSATVRAVATLGFWLVPNSNSQRIICAYSSRRKQSIMTAFAGDHRRRLISLQISKGPPNPYPSSFDREEGWTILFRRSPLGRETSSVAARMRALVEKMERMKR